MSENVVEITDKDIEEALKDVEKSVAPVKNSVTLDNFIDPDQVKKDLSINVADLDTAMAEHPGLELEYARATANARRQHERLKSAFDILEAKLNARYRESLSQGGKKPTVDQIANSVTGDKAWSSGRSLVIDAQHIWKLCEATESAFHSRKDMILEIARDRRKEREGEMRVMENTALRDAALARIANAA